MTRTRSGPLDNADAVGSKAREFSGRIRRMAVTRTNSALLQVAGHNLLEGEQETWDAEQFQGIGFAARPADDEETEAIVAFVGGPGNPIVIATRNEATRISMAADLAAGETQLHNPAVLIRIKANGTVEIRTKAGIALPLPTLAEHNALAAFVQAMTLPVVGATAGPPAPGAVPTASGTTVLKAE